MLNELCTGCHNGSPNSSQIYKFTLKPGWEASLKLKNDRLNEKANFSFSYTHRISFVCRRVRSEVDEFSVFYADNGDNNTTSFVLLVHPLLTRGYYSFCFPMLEAVSSICSVQFAILVLLSND